MSEVRSSELKTGLSSSGDLMEGDTAVSNPQRLGLSTPLKRSVSWMLIHWVGLRTDFNSRSGSGFACLVKRNEPVISSPGRCAFMSPPSSVG